VAEAATHKEKSRSLATLGMTRNKDGSGEVLGFYFEEAGDDGGGLLPVLSFGLESFAAGLGEAVEAGAAIVVGGAPFGFDGTFLFEF
jgi:hypothetical protein